MKTLPIALLAAVLVLGGCQFITPPPEVRVTDVDPVSYEVYQNAGGTFIYPSVTLEITNNVEAVVTGFQVGYYDATGDHSVASKTILIPMHAEFSATMTLSSLPVEISSDMISYMYSNGTNAVIRLFITGEDAYGRGLEFDTDVDIGIYALDL